MRGIARDSHCDSQYGLPWVTAHGGLVPRSLLVLRAQVIVYKMRPKKHYRRKNGHRQPLSRFMVTKVGA